VAPFIVKVAAHLRRIVTLTQTLRGVTTEVAVFAISLLLYSVLLHPETLVATIIGAIGLATIPFVCVATVPYRDWQYEHAVLSRNRRGWLVLGVSTLIMPCLLATALLPLRYWVVAIGPAAVVLAAFYVASQKFPAPTESGYWEDMYDPPTALRAEAAHRTAVAHYTAGNVYRAYYWLDASQRRHADLERAEMRQMLRQFAHHRSEAARLLIRAQFAPTPDERIHFEEFAMREAQAATEALSFRVCDECKHVTPLQDVRCFELNNGRFKSFVCDKCRFNIGREAGSEGGVSEDLGDDGRTTHSETNDRESQSQSRQTDSDTPSTHTSSEMGIEEARTLLGVAPDYTKQDVAAAFRENVKTAHPDAGGSSDSFIQLVTARDTLEATLGE
jgi:hypothetical protein